MAVAPYPAYSDWPLAVTVASPKTYHFRRVVLGAKLL